MSLFSSLLRRKPLVIAETAASKPEVLTRGRWVYHTGLQHVGILVGAQNFPNLQVQLTNERGEDFRLVTCLPTDIRTAAWKEIPESRRPSQAVAAGLGYY